jgi:O-antigen ligase
MTIAIHPLSSMKKVFSKINADSIFFYILVIFILTLPYNISTWWVGTFSIILFLLTLVNPLREKSVRTIIHERSLQILFVFILFTYISVLWSESPVLFNGDLQTNIGRFKYYFLIIPAIYLSNLSKKDINKLFILIASAPALSIILYYTNSLGISNIAASQNPNSSLIFRNHLIQNFFILFSILFLCINTFSAIETKKYNKIILYLPLFLIASLSLVIDPRAHSRLMGLAFLLILITIPFYYLPTKKYFFLLLILLITSSLVITSSSKFQTGIRNFTQTIESDEYKQSWGHRTGFLLSGIEIFKENPIIGRGINDISRSTYKIAEDKPKYFSGTHLRHFHNEHINILVAVGIFGYILLMYFLLLLFKLNIKDKNIYVFKNTTIIIMFLLMMGEHYLSFKSTTNFFSILIALFITYKSLEKTRDNSSPTIK